MRGQSLKDLYESTTGKTPLEKGERLACRIHDLMEADEGKQPRLKPEDFSLKEIAEAVDPTAFPVITGQLVSKKLMDAFKVRDKIGPKVTTTFTSKLQVDKVPGVYYETEIHNLNSGEPYPHSGNLKEKYVQLEGAKRGMILDITEEAIMFDQTGLVLKRAADFGEAMAADKEKKILYTMQDISGYEAYYPNGSQTALYISANSIDNALEDFTDIDAAEAKLGAMTDENGDPIDVMSGSIVMLVPIALKTMAARLRGAIMPGVANAEANPYADAYQPYASPYLDTNSTTAWFYGDAKRTFLWKEVIPLQTLVRKNNDNDDAWNRDVKASYKCRYYGDCGAQDYRFFIKSTGTVS
jgi:hypothetical protein